RLEGLRTVPSAHDHVDAGLPGGHRTDAMHDATGENPLAARERLLDFANDLFRHRAMDIVVEGGEPIAAVFRPHRSGEDDECSGIDALRLAQQLVEGEGLLTDPATHGSTPRSREEGGRSRSPGGA